MIYKREVDRDGSIYIELGSYLAAATSVASWHLSSRDRIDESEGELDNANETEQGNGSCLDFLLNRITGFLPLFMSLLR